MRHRACHQCTHTSGITLSLSPDADPAGIDDDWVENYFEKCRNVSDSEMQALWSRVLASEANSPGKFSRKTVNLLEDIGKDEAQAFASLCRFECTIMGKANPLVVGVNQPFYTSENVTSESLSVLEELGLVELAQTSYLEKARSNFVEIKYFDCTVTAENTSPKDLMFMTGRVLYTRAGKELSSICSSTPVEGFFNWLKSVLRPNGFFLNDEFD